MRWHGICEGDLTIAAVEEIDNCQQLSVDVQENNKITNGASAGFILCSCYDAFIENGYLDDGCIVTKQSSVVRDEDFCIVSIRDDGSQIDLTQPLPKLLILKHVSKGSNQHRPDMNQELITAINTACGETEPPLFPGYGKFAGTCSPHEGIIDLGISALPLPQAIDHYSGNPPQEMFWYEFMDGTSTGFWPTTDALLGVKSSWFNPTFASCSCTECTTSAPSTSPTVIPSTQPSDIPSQISTIRNTRQEVLGCPPSTYESCNAFSQTFCVGNGQGSIPFGETCSYSPNASVTNSRNDNPLERKLQDMESLVEYVQVNGLDDSAIETLHRIFDHDQVTNEEWVEWLQSEREYHLQKYNDLSQP